MSQVQQIIAAHNATVEQQRKQFAALEKQIAALEKQKDQCRATSSVVVGLAEARDEIQRHIDGRISAAIREIKATLGGNVQMLVKAQTNAAAIEDIQAWQTRTPEALLNVKGGAEALLLSIAGAYKLPRGMDYVFNRQNVKYLVRAANKAEVRIAALDDIVQLESDLSQLLAFNTKASNITL